MENTHYKRTNVTNFLLNFVIEDDRTTPTAPSTEMIIVNKCDPEEYCCKRIFCTCESVIECV